jgi:uncharacterized membrane protein HdeD (DUF308 family)
VFTGVTQVVTAIQVRKEIDNEWMLILSGIVSIVFGFLLILFPESSIVTLLWLFAVLAIAWGVMLIIFSLRLRGMGGSTSTPTRASA